MTVRVDPKDLTTPHFVEWAVSEECEDEDWSDVSFSERQDALNKASELHAAGQCVLVGEVGTYTSMNGNPIQDYIYYWWNGYFYFSPGSRGETGVPMHAMSLHVDYVPHDRSSM